MLTLQIEIMRQSGTRKRREMKSDSSIALTFCIFFFISLWFIPSHATAQHNKSNTHTTILSSSLDGANYAFDIYSLPLWDQPSTSIELRLTDGHSVNFNGHFPSSTPSSIISLTPNQTSNLQLIYVTHRNGTSSINLDILYANTLDRTRKRSILEAPTELTGRVQVPLAGCGTSSNLVSMKDRPSLAGDCLIYVSTHENPGVAHASWAAVYSTQLTTGLTRRLTPYGVADFSPAVSPSGVWTAVASYGDRGWDGSKEELKTDIYLFLTQDGSKRVKVIEHGGWPTWADKSTLYFHRRCEDEWWSVFRAILPVKGKLGTDSVVIQRVTPPGLHAFTPASSPANTRFIAVATRRPDSEYRHVEIYDVISEEFRELTRAVSPNAHHLNPFISPDSSRVGYHRCRGADNGEQKSTTLLLQNLQNPMPEISLFRINGTFPSFSPTGERIAYVNPLGLYVVNSDGSDNREVLHGSVFATSWDPKRKGVVYTSLRSTFGCEIQNVNVISVNVNDDQLSYKQLTTRGENNAFPWPSPDGKWVVFRSARSGHKNLYIMDAIRGEMGGVGRLTEGPWTDTMCNWSPDGEWIAFASNRDNPSLFSFALYIIHPNGTGLRKLFQSGPGGEVAHPYFSPDGNRLVFTSEYAAVSAEPISNPNHYPPSGEIYTIKLDGSDLRRLTHNSFEDGTPAWGPKFMRSVDVESSNDGPRCAFEDCQWLNISLKLGAVNDPDGSTRTQCAR